MKRLPILCLLLVANTSFFFAQTEQQRIDLQGAKSVHIHAAFSSVEVSVGEDGVIGVNHNLTIEGEARADLRKLAIKREGDVLTIREMRPNLKSLRQRFMPRSIAATPAGFSSLNGGNLPNTLLVDATLKVVVPAGIPVAITTEHGSIFANNVPGLVKAEAKYGSVSVVYQAGKPLPQLELSSSYGAVTITVPSGENLSFDLLTEYGSLHDQLNIALDDAASEEREFYQRVVGTLGAGGRTVRCSAPYGDVYLREGE